MKIRRRLFCFVLLAFVFFPALQASLSFAQGPVTYTAGVMTKSYDERRTKALEKFEEIIGKYIEERAGFKIRLRALTYPDLVKALEKESVDFVWGYGLVVSMELSQKHHSILPILTPTLGEDKRAFFKRLAVASKDAAPDLVDLKGFRGKRLAYVGGDEWSFELLVFKVWAAEKYGVRDITQILTLKGRGRDPDEGFFIPGSKRGAIYSLFVNEADLALAHEFEYLTQEKLTPNAIRERAEVLPLVNSHEGFMEAPVFVRKGVNKQDIDRLIKAFMEMPNDPEGKQILLSSKISGFVRVTDQNYQPVRALMTKKESLGIK